MLKLRQSEIPSASWIIKDTEKSLLADCQTVALPLSKENEIIMKKMIDWVQSSQDETFNKNHQLVEAIGIAAPQIGVNLKMYYIYVPIINPTTEVKTYAQHALINPKIIGRSLQIAALENGEACLSVDNKHEGLVPRNYKIQVQGYDYLKQKEVTMTVRGYEAIVFQHEQDHLENKVYYNHINEKNPWDQKPEWIMI